MHDEEKELENVCIYTIIHMYVSSFSISLQVSEYQVLNGHVCGSLWNVITFCKGINVNYSLFSF